MPPRRSSTRAAANGTAGVAQTSDKPFTEPEPNTSLPPNLVTLRRNWKWAAFCQFFFTFSPLFNMDDVKITDIEDDLCYSTGIVLPRIMRRLLYTLTQDRRLNDVNWQSSLRRQYLRRNPGVNPLGSEPSNSNIHDVPSRHETPGPESTDTALSESYVNMEKNETQPPSPSSVPAPLDEAVSAGSNLSKETTEADSTEKTIDWMDLTMLEKLESLHILQEWQFQNVYRLRATMKDDDETAQWRIEPIGYDSKLSAYWLIGDRLWIQRSPPRASPPKKSLKRKRSPVKSEAMESKSNKKPTAASLDSFTHVSQKPTVQANGRTARAAKMDANRKLDAQAKAFAEYQRQTAAEKSGHARKPVAPPPRVRGTRTSARLRGPTQDDDWQPIPDEWLNDNDYKLALAKSRQDADTSSLSSLSDLTDLPEDEAPAQNSDKFDDIASESGHEEPHAAEPEIKTESAPPIEFIEWETIAATLYEWEHVAERFEKSTHYAEKRLYKLLANDLVPPIVAELREIERKKRIEEALVNRKRSSRLAIKENERETARLAAIKEAEEREQRSRAARMEARQRREETERLKKKNDREQRMKERQEREMRAQVEKETKPQQPGIEANPIKTDPTHTDSALGAEIRSHPSLPASSRSAASSSQKELSCDICRACALSQDDPSTLVGCQRCGRLQHKICHENADISSGRPKRDWGFTPFLCQQCLHHATSALHSGGGPQMFDGRKANNPQINLGIRNVLQIPSSMQQAVGGSLGNFRQVTPNPTHAPPVMGRSHILSYNNPQQVHPYVHPSIYAASSTSAKPIRYSAGWVPETNGSLPSQASGAVEAPYARYSQTVFPAHPSSAYAQPASTALLQGYQQQYTSVDRQYSSPPYQNSNAVPSENPATWPTGQSVPIGAMLESPQSTPTTQQHLHQPYTFTEPRSYS